MRILMGVEPQPADTFVALLAGALRDRGHEVECSVERALTPAPGFDLVHLHWPEALWGWGGATDEDLHAVEEALDGWGELGVPVVWTRHNAEPHHDAGEAGAAICRRVAERADGVVHLGRHSLEDGGAAGRAEVVIPHGAYPRPAEVSRADARAQIGFDADAFMVLVFGSIRHPEEQEFILDTAERLHEAGPLSVPAPGGSCPPVLAVPRWDDATLPSRLRAPLQRLRAERTRSRGHSALRTGPGLIPDGQVPVWLAAADVVLIPRLEVLNSGVLLLACSHGRAAVGPRTGNLTEVLEETGCPTFPPGDAEAAARVIRELASEGADRVGARAAEVVHGRWGWPAMAERHEAFYGDRVSAASSD